MRSHLPQPVFDQLSLLTRGLDEGLQADGHFVSKAIEVTKAFDQNWIDSALRRGVLGFVAAEVAQLHDIPYATLANGGFEAKIIHDGITRSFRLRQARLTNRTMLKVTSSTDSLLTKKARGTNRSFFDDNVESVSDDEFWILAYLMDGPTRTLKNVYAAFPNGTIGDKAPYTLTFDDVVPIPLAVPTPPSFPESDDDLHLGDDEGEDEDREDEEGTEGAA